MFSFQAARPDIGNPPDVPWAGKEPPPNKLQHDVAIAEDKVIQSRHEANVNIPPEHVWKRRLRKLSWLGPRVRTDVWQSIEY